MKIGPRISSISITGARTFVSHMLSCVTTNARTAKWPAVMTKRDWV